MSRHGTVQRRSQSAVQATLVLAALVAVGCEGGTYSRGLDAGGTGGRGSLGGTGGDAPVGTGGSPDATGGAGAEPVSSGGAGGAASGGMAGTGGRGGSGGTLGSGGAATAGTTGRSGGAAGSGGRGGANTGGAASGGSGSGGRGGANTGGAATGGANTGGAATGGANTGGAATGGANTGGAATGGAATGGASTGGMGTGGAATGGMGTGGAAAPSGAILYYPFDETTGTSVADQSGNARNGTVAGGGTFAAGVIGNGLTFAGGTTTATQTYVSIPAGILTSVRDMTISLWVSVTNDVFWQRVLDFGKSATTGHMFLTTRGAGDTLRFVITSTDRFAEQIVDTPKLPLNTWKHVAVVLGAAGGSLYVDGVKMNTSAAVTLRPADLGTITNHWLGRSQYPSDPYFGGRMDELRIYARALSDAEVAQLFTLR